MNGSIVKLYYGEGKGKSILPLGRALICAGEGKRVFVVQFLKGRTNGELNYLRGLEPEIKIFRFEKNEGYFEDISEE